MFCGIIGTNDAKTMYQFDETNNKLIVKYRSDEWINEISTKTLEGSIFPKNRNIIFYKESCFKYLCGTVTTNINMLIEKKCNKYGVSKIQFNLKELDFMFSDFNKINKDVFKRSDITIPTFEELNTKEYDIEIDKKKMKFLFEYSYTIAPNDLSPINFNLYFSIIYDFNNDYDLIYKTIKYVKKLFSFLCYRSNINFEEIKISYKNSDNKYEQNGIIKFFNESIIEKDLESDIKKSVFPFYLVRDNIDTIFQRIIDNKIGLRYLPDSYYKRDKYFPPRLFMICSTFEFEFRESFGNKVEHEKKTIQEREHIKNLLDNIILNNELNSKEKSIINRMKRIADSESYSSMVKEILKKSELINNISKDYYSIHGKSYNITPLCNTLQTMRNDLAHYNINGRYEESRLFAIRLLEIMIYCMQLSCCNISDDNIVFIIQYIFNN